MYWYWYLCIDGRPAEQVDGAVAKKHTTYDMAHYGVLCLDQGSLSVRASLVAGWDQLAEEMKSNAQPFVSPDHRAAAGLVPL